MKFSATFTVFATLLAIVYGVAFSNAYPRVEIDTPLVMLCVLLSLATCFILVALWRLATGSRTPQA